MESNPIMQFLGLASRTSFGGSADNGAGFGDLLLGLMGQRTGGQAKGEPRPEPTWLRPLQRMAVHTAVSGPREQHVSVTSTACRAIAEPNGTGHGPVRPAVSHSDRPVGSTSHPAQCGPGSRSAKAVGGDASPDVSENGIDDCRSDATDNTAGTSVHCDRAAGKDDDAEDGEASGPCAEPEGSVFPQDPSLTLAEASIPPVGPMPFVAGPLAARPEAGDDGDDLSEAGQPTPAGAGTGNGSATEGAAEAAGMALAAASDAAAVPELAETGNLAEEDALEKAHSGNSTPAFHSQQAEGSRKASVSFLSSPGQEFIDAPAAGGAVVPGTGGSTTGEHRADGGDDFARRGSARRTLPGGQGAVGMQQHGSLVTQAATPTGNEKAAPSVPNDSGPLTPGPVSATAGENEFSVLGSLPGWNQHLAQGAALRRPDFVATLRQHLQNLPVHEQVALSIQRSLREGGGSITLQLSPVELGRINVKLRIDEENNVQATVSVERPATLELLQRDMKSLERALQEAGLKSGPGDLSFSLQGGNPDSFAREFSDDGRPGAGNRDSGTDEAAEALPGRAPAAVIATGDGLVDVEI